MAQCVFLVFIPALTLSKLALAVSIESIVRFWALLANMTIGMVLGLALGVLVAWALRVPAGARRQVVAAVAFGNVGNLPLVFVFVLVGSQGAPNNGLSCCSMDQPCVTAQPGALLPGPA